MGEWLDKYVGSILSLCDVNWIIIPDVYGFLSSSLLNLFFKFLVHAQSSKFTQWLCWINKHMRQATKSFSLKNNISLIFFQLNYNVLMFFSFIKNLFFLLFSLSYKNVFCNYFYGSKNLRAVEKVNTWIFDTKHG